MLRWILPEIGSAEVIEYEFVSAEDRAGEQIELKVDLVIGDTTQPGHEIFKTNALAVSDQCVVFVKDISPKRILVYDRDGEFQRVIGREGEGPGEFSSIAMVLIVDDTLTIPDSAKGRFLRWSLDGDWLNEVPASIYQPGSVVLALRNGAVLTETVRPNGQTSVISLRRVSLVGEPPYEFPALTVKGVMVAIDGRQRTLILDEAPWPLVATERRSGTVYLGHGEAYQVAAYGQDGTPKWGLKVAAPRYAITRAAKRAAVDRMARVLAMFGGATAVSIGDVAWPEFAGAIRALRVDGRGRLYVFPRMSGTTDREAPVDVFSPQGELLFSGTMPFFHWGDVVDDYILHLHLGSHRSRVHANRCAIQARRPWTKTNGKGCALSADWQGRNSRHANGRNKLSPTSSPFFFGVSGGGLALAWTRNTTKVIIAVPDRQLAISLCEHLLHRRLRGGNGKPCGGSRLF